MNDKNLICPFCKNINIEAGYLQARSKPGSFNFFTGFSAGIKSKLYWSKNKNGFCVDEIEFNNLSESYKCNECNAIFLNADIKKTKFIIFSDWLKLIIILSISLFLVYLIKIV